MGLKLQGSKFSLRELSQVVQPSYGGQFVVIEIQLSQRLQSRHRFHVWNEVLAESEDFDLSERGHDLWEGLETPVSEIHLLVCVCVCCCCVLLCVCVLLLCVLLCVCVCCVCVCCVCVCELTRSSSPISIILSLTASSSDGVNPAAHTNTHTHVSYNYTPLRVLPDVTSTGIMYNQGVHFTKLGLYMKKEPPFYCASIVYTDLLS